MKVIANHVIITGSGEVGRFEELEDGQIIYLHHKLKPRLVDKDLFNMCDAEKKLPPISSLN